MNEIMDSFWGISSEQLLREIETTPDGLKADRRCDCRALRGVCRVIQGDFLQEY